MSDFNRKQFEDYYNDWGGFGCQYCLHHRMGDSYNIPDVAKAWRHWQASRECLVIELPESVTNSGTAYIETIRAFIEKQGIKTK